METRDRILRAAAAVFEEHGFRGATTRRIAAEAGVNEVTLFRHFGDKERLLRSALAAVSGAAAGPVLPAEPVDPESELVSWCGYHLAEMHRVRALIRTSMGEFEEHPEVTSCGSRRMVEVAGELREYLGRLREAGQIRRDLDDHVAANVLLGAVFADAMSRDIMAESYPYDRKKAAARYVDVFLEGVKP